MRTSLTTDTWNEVMTTTVDTLLQVEGGPVRFQTGDVSGAEKNDGVKILSDGIIIFPAGLTVSAFTKTAGVVIISVPFGA